MSMPGGINSHQLKWFQNVSKNSIKIVKGCGTVAAMCTVLHICPFCWWFRPTDQYFVPREIALLQDHPALNTYGCSTQLCIQSWSHKLKVPACSLSSTQFLETRRIWLRYVKVCWGQTELKVLVGWPVTGHAYNSGAHVRVPPKNMPFFTHPFAYSQLTLLTWTWSWLFGYSIRPNSNLQLMESRRMTSQSVGFRNLGMFGQGTYSPYTYALISLA